MASERQVYTIQRTEPKEDKNGFLGVTHHKLPNGLAHSQRETIIHCFPTLVLHTYLTTTIHVHKVHCIKV